MMHHQDTIAAISTAPVMAAIGVIRISGKNAFSIVQKVFDKNIEKITSRSVLVGNIKDQEEIIDQVVLCLYRAPNSYTGEDVIEISCHGSLYLLRTILQLLIKKGARQAQNGEFTKRAFINGKMDLSQAEAVIDLIEAESKKESRLAIQTMEGSLSKKIQVIRKELIDICSQIMAYIDFPDDEIADISSDSLKYQIQKSLEQIEKLINTFSQGMLIKSGVKTSICGKPNVGKSCLMNKILGHERSIVTNCAGTTRDIVTETVVFGGVKMILADTAGIRDTDNEVELLGVQRAKAYIEESNLIFFVMDNATGFNKEDYKILNTLQQVQAVKIAVLNKCDMGIDAITTDLSMFDTVVKISAKDGTGISSLEKAVRDSFIYLDNNEEVIMNLRQYECLQRGKKFLLHALQNIELTPDAIIVDVEESISALGEIIGKTVSTEIIDNIFSRFCVGK